ncbi:MAG: VCBS domain-containing protein, partial [Gallionella sp.]
MKKHTTRAMLAVALTIISAASILGTASLAVAETTASPSASNQAAILGSASVVLTETNSVLSANGRLSISDADSPAKFVAQKNVAGTYGKFNINSAGAWTYVTNSPMNELNAGQSVSDSFPVASADGTTSSVQVTINGTNDPAVLGAANVVLMETDAVLTTGGTLSIRDVDNPETFVVQSNVAGANGTFNIDSAGAWTYLANSAFDNLSAGQSIKDSFTVSSADGTTTTVKVTIKGTNDPAILGSANEVLTETNEPLHASGKLTISDVDNPATFVAKKNVRGAYGTFNIDSAGAWTYDTNGAVNRISEGQSVIDSFTAASADGTRTKVQVTINGTNDPAALGAANVVLKETNAPLKTTGRLSISDVDSPAKFVAQSNVSGKNGSFSIDSAGRWTYVANNAFDGLNVGQSVSDSFPVASADGTTSSVQVTINGTNDPAILGSASITLDETNEPLSTAGTLSIRDVDSPETFIAQSNVAGKNGTFNIDRAGTWTYIANSAFDELNKGQSLSDSFTVSSADGTTTTVKVTIKGTNDPAILGSAN